MNPRGSTPGEQLQPKRLTLLHLIQGFSCLTLNTVSTVQYVFKALHNHTGHTFQGICRTRWHILCTKTQQNTIIKLKRANLRIVHLRIGYLAGLAILNWNCLYLPGSLANARVSSESKVFNIGHKSGNSLLGSRGVRAKLLEGVQNWSVASAPDQRMTSW